MSDYVQEMAAVVCVFDSGEIKVASMHMTSHEAHDELTRLRETGEDREWIGGRLFVMDNGICHAHVDTDKLQARLAAIEELSRQ